VLVPFTELKIWEHQVRYEVDRRRREIGALGRFEVPPVPNQCWAYTNYEMFSNYCDVEGA
jgi:hypothetical protein